MFCSWESNRGLGERWWQPTARYMMNLSVYWLLAVLAHKALHGHLPQYLAEDCQLLTNIGHQSLRSANVLTCATIRTRTRLGDRSFSVTGPCLWNSRPVALRDKDILLAQFVFWRHFGLCRAAAHSDCCFFASCTNILTYLEFGKAPVSVLDLLFLGSAGDCLGRFVFKMTHNVLSTCGVLNLTN